MRKGSAVAKQYEEFNRHQEILERLEALEEKMDKLMAGQSAQLQQWAGYEYKSKATLFGLPLVHVAQGRDPETGRIRVAKGVIAIGGVAIGGLTLGGTCLGVICLGGLCLGIVSLGGIAIGALLAAGGLAVGAFAVGGLAIGYVAIGGAALGAYALDAQHTNPEAITKLLRNLFGTK